MTTITGCTCPPVWNGVVPPSCPMHNPPLPMTGRTTTTTAATVPAWVHMADIPPTGEVDDDPWPDERAHVTPVGCWALLSFGLLAVIVYAAWRMLRG